MDFAVDVAVDKYINHLPLDRQRRMMGRAGLEIDTQTLWDQIEALARHLEPSYQALRSYILDADVVGADETWWRLMDGSGSKRWWAWSLTVPDAVWHGIAPSRSAATARGFIGDFEGTLMVDGYKAYETLAADHGRIRLAHCWAHVRRASTSKRSETTRSAARRSTCSASSSRSTTRPKTPRSSRANVVRTPSARDSRLATPEGFTIEENFRDSKDPRFGFGMSASRISTPERRDRLFLISALAVVLLTLLGAAGEEIGIDRYLKVNTSKRRQLSLLRQGSEWYALIPMMETARLRKLMTKFGQMIQDHALCRRVVGVV